MGGCASKVIWGCKRSLATGWKEPARFLGGEGKVDVPTSAVEEMMSRRNATDLYQDFMTAVYAVLDASWLWRGALLKTREQFASRFCAAGIDLWVCSEHVSSYGIDDFWILFVDRSVAPSNVKQSIQWRNLLWWSKQESVFTNMNAITEEMSPLVGADYCK